MVKNSWMLLEGGAALIVLASLFGFAVSVFNYYDPQSGIAGEPGTLLVIASTMLLSMFGLAMVANRRRSIIIRIFFIVASFLNIAGTAFAGYLLHSQTLVILMLISLFGWIFHVFRRRLAFA